MSKNIIIEKAGVPQELDGAKKIVTNSPDLLQVTWIPEESTKPIGKLTVHRNGHYEASDLYAYGFDEVKVDVPQSLPSIEGRIGLDIPTIDVDYPDIDFNIDGINIDDIDIEIPDIDPSNIDINDLKIIIDDIILGIIDDHDLDIDIDDIDIYIPDIDFSELTIEELKDLINDIIIDAIRDIIGELDIDNDEISVPDVDVIIPDPEIEIPDYPSDVAAITHIDDNGNIIVITVEDLEEMDITIEDIEAMEDPVLTIDDLGNMNIVDSLEVEDFGDLEVLDLALGDIDMKIDGIDLNGRSIISDEDYLPTSIELTVPPRKLEYRDGEAINLAGAVVTAKYKGGTAVWANEKYRNGIIPLGELRVKIITNPNDGSGDESGIVKFDPKVKKVDHGKYTFHSSAYVKGTDHAWNYDERTQYIEYEVRTNELMWISQNCQYQYSGTAYIWHKLRALIFGTQENLGTSDFYQSYYLPHEGHSIIQGSQRSYGPYREVYMGTVSYKIDGATPTYSPPDDNDLEFGPVVFPSDDLNADGALAAAHYLLFEHPENMKWTCDNTVFLSWPRPKDGKILSTSFKITVEQEA